MHRVSTGLKMLLILLVALLPLGLVAILSSRESAQANRLRQEAVARAMATASAAAIDTKMRPDLFALRRAIDDIAPDRIDRAPDAEQCRLRLAGLTRTAPDAGAYAVIDPQGRLVCATPRYSRLPAYPAHDEDGAIMMLVARKALVRATVAATHRGYGGIAEFPAARIARFAQMPPDSRAGISLRQGAQILRLVAPRNQPLEEMIRISIPVAGGQFSLEMGMPATPVTFLELTMIFLPLILWAAGAMIGWIVVERLLLHPLRQIESAVTGFHAGSGPLQIPRLRTPAHEIVTLGASFTDATNEIMHHEQELAEGLARQKRLTREVHHRIKNNLQIISSLISLQTRAAAAPELGEAYASIQRRVDALAMVHRHHYAETEDNSGVPLCLLLGEIASNLHPALDNDAPSDLIRLDLAPLWVAQDLAVPIAFLTTELIELVASCAIRDACAPDMSISLKQTSPDRARALLGFTAPLLARAPPEGSQADWQIRRFRRIADGFARQIKSPLRFEATAGHYEIEIPVLTPRPHPGEG